MDISKLINMNTLIAGGILFAAYKYGPNGTVKAAAAAVAAVAIAKQVPYVQTVL